MERNYLLALIIFGTLLLLTLLGIIVLFIIVHKQRTQKYREALLHIRIEVQEQALDWISREIHDNIGQVLSIIRMQLKYEANARDKQQMAERMKEAAEHIGRCISDLRNMSHILNSGMIEKMGLQAAIGKELNYIRSLNNLKCTFTCDENMELTDEQNLLLFRITQECLNNIMRHARATEVEVNLTHSEDHIDLSIEDNGIGMDKKRISKDKGMGLTNIRQRVALLNGRLVIHSVPGKGTKIKITLKSKNNGRNYY